jgi:hypothetical protein
VFVFVRMFELCAMIYLHDTTPINRLTSVAG